MQVVKTLKPEMLHAHLANPDRFSLKQDKLHVKNVLKGNISSTQLYVWRVLKTILPITQAIQIALSVPLNFLHSIIPVAAAVRPLKKLFVNLEHMHCTTAQVKILLNVRTARLIHIPPAELLTA
jgi:hypothetical protein